MKAFWTDFECFEHFESTKCEKMRVSLGASSFDAVIIIFIGKVVFGYVRTSTKRFDKKWERSYRIGM